MKWLLGLLARTPLKGAAAKALNPFSAAGASASWASLRNQFIIGAGASLLMPGTTKEKVTNAVANTTALYLTLGMNSGWRQFGWGVALSLVPSFGMMARGIVQGYRGVIESRTAAAIPFSYSTMGMDQAFATLQYSRQRLSEGYQNVGSEAAFFSARYMSRG